jgi:flagellar basal-body rod protein FlgC
MFPSIGTAASGMRVYQTWVDAVSDNVANINTIRPAGTAPFRERLVVAQSTGDRAGGTGRGAGVGTGAHVAGVVFGSAEGRLAYQPDHPFADDQGMVRLPDVDLPTQMTNLIIAQRAYQANVTVFERARDAYLRALEIGR